MMRLAVLGSTGSIGTQTLDVVANNRDSIEVVALAARSNCELIAAQAISTGARRVVIADRSKKDDPHLAALVERGVRVDFGPEALEEICADEDVDCVLNALVGEAGLRASMRTLKQRKRLALANKESLVVGGDLIMEEATHETLLPVDSEHGAIYQCLIGERHDEVARLWVTASGGPFFGYSRDQLRDVTRKQALAHPTWKMGPKITIDSATMMNKGLEVIEAHHLFSMDYEDISVVVQPQSCIHSMVEYTDGSVKAHLGVTDMRIPIQYALSYPSRWPAPAKPLDFTELGSLQFAAPDPRRSGALASRVRRG